ncbi:RHS repeat-associated core domain-containing protein, partial [Kurthia gibsonii]|uniref:RHS repeat-associated core domain-containing protein n=1 Tax=Kurthia gibsonii TaxID=33946 RepID=UPI0011416511
YGNILTVEGDLAKANSIRYAGYYYDDETKNYYLQARYYNPANGSFLSLDPHPGDDDEPLSQNGYTYGNNNPVMNVDSNGLKPNRIFYALMTSIAYVVAAVVGDLKDVAFIAQTLWSMIKDYFDVKKAKSQRTTEAARKVVRNSRALSKVIEKRAKKAARIAGVAVLRKSFGGWYLLGRFSIGIYQGGRNKYFQYAPCYRSAYTYGSYVAKKRLG